MHQRTVGIDLGVKSPDVAVVWEEEGQRIIEVIQFEPVSQGACSDRTSCYCRWGRGDETPRGDGENVSSLSVREQVFLGSRSRCELCETGSSQRRSQVLMAEGKNGRTGRVSDGSSAVFRSAAVGSGSCFQGVDTRAEDSGETATVSSQTIDFLEESVGPVRQRCVAWRDRGVGPGFKPWTGAGSRPGTAQGCSAR